jgi:hypothetical protein
MLKVLMLSAFLAMAPGYDRRPGGAAFSLVPLCPHCTRPVAAFEFFAALARAQLAFVRVKSLGLGLSL